jgi:hypothetical protein
MKSMYSIIITRRKMNLLFLLDPFRVAEENTGVPQLHGRCRRKKTGGLYIGFVLLSGPSIHVFNHIYPLHSFSPFINLI